MLKQLSPFIGRDTRGVAAIEFALAGTLSLVLLLGMADFVPFVLARYKVAHAASNLADVASVSSALQFTDMINVMAAPSDVLSPLPSTALSYRVSNIASDGAGRAFVYWSCAIGVSPLTALSVVTTTPTGVPVENLLLLTNAVSGSFVLQGTNSSFVMVEMSYSYAPPAQFVLTGSWPMSSTAYAAPRAAAYVGFPWTGSAAVQPPAPASTTTVNTAALASGGATCSYAS